MLSALIGCGFLCPGRLRSSNCRPPSCRHSGVFLGAAIIVFLCSCTLKEKSETSPPSVTQIVKAKPLTPEQSEEMLREVGQNWLYGQGVGETALTAGGIVLFPPYALWVIGNAALSLSGYEPISVSDALPDEEKKAWRETYDTVTGAPGRMNAALAGKEFRSQEVAREKLHPYLDPASVGPEK